MDINQFIQDLMDKNIKIDDAIDDIKYKINELEQEIDNQEVIRNEMFKSIKLYGFLHKSFYCRSREYLLFDVRYAEVDSGYECTLIDNKGCSTILEFKPTTFIDYGLIEATEKDINFFKGKELARAEMIIENNKKYKKVE